MSRHRLILPGLVLLAYGLAFAQRPGKLVADTLVDLEVGPGRLLGRLTAAWVPTGDLGHVWAPGDGGLLFPMASWFAAGDALGISAWVVQRLWLGTLLLAAAWGVVRLMEVLWERDRGVAHAAAAVLYVANPYVVVCLNRSSLALLPYAALPWLLLCLERGLRDPRGWRWPAALALVLAATGGGPRIAAIGWVLAPLPLLVLYDLRWGGLAPRALVAYGWRLAIALAVASAWWLAPLVVHARYGESGLPLALQPRGISSSSSLGEALRLFGRLSPPAGFEHVLTDSRVVVLAGLLVPGLALAGFIWTRERRYAPFFLALTMLGTVAVAASRSAYAAGPSVALGIAVLGGGALRAAQARIPYRRHRFALACAGAVLVAAAAWPLVTGKAMERRLQFDLPPAWSRLARDLEHRPDSSRALVEPGRRLAFQRWGGTVENALPALTDHAVTARSYSTASDPRAAGLMLAVDDLIAGGRVLPGQLRPLLNMLAVGDVVVDADAGPAVLGATTALAPVLDSPGASYGPSRLVRPSGARIASAQRLPELRRVELETLGMVRVLPRGPATIVGGGPQGIVTFAGYGDLPTDRPIRSAQDLTRSGLRAAAHAGATIVAADARDRARIEQALRGAALDRATLQELFRRRAGEPQLRRTMRPPAARSWTAQAWVLADPVASDAALDRLVGTRGPGSATSSGRFEQRPAFRASSAFDGDPATAWAAPWGSGGARLTWTTRRAVAVRRLRLVAPAFVARTPRLVVLNGRRAGVAADGSVRFAPAVRGTRFRLDVVRATFPGGTPRHLRRRAAVAIAEVSGAGLRLSVPRSGSLRAPCGSAAVAAGNAKLALRITGSVADLDAGRPLAARGCGVVTLPGAPTAVRGLARPLVVDDLQLVSAPPGGIVLPGQGGVVVRQGRARANGGRSGVRVSIDGPSWLVLAQAYNRGWRARCNGRDLGLPTPIEGYANGWLVDRGCTSVEFRFAPNDALRLAYLLSIFGIPFLLVAVVRRRRPGYTSLEPLPDAGVRVPRLLAAAAVLLAAGVPAAYLLAPWYGAHRAGHWVLVAGFALLAAALIRTLLPARAPGPRADASR